MFNWVKGIYSGTAATFGLAFVLIIAIVILEITNKAIPSVFTILLTGLTGGGVAIAASGGSPTPPTTTEVANTTSGTQNYQA